MRANRLYRIRARQAGKAHAARADATGTLVPRALCGTRLPARYADPSEIRGNFGRDDDCGRCRRVLST